MARYKKVNYDQMELIPVSFNEQIVPEHLNIQWVLFNMVHNTCGEPVESIGKIQVLGKIK